VACSQMCLAGITPWSLVLTFWAIALSSVETTKPSYYTSPLVLCNYIQGHSQKRGIPAKRRNPTGRDPKRLNGCMLQVRYCVGTAEQTVRRGPVSTWRAFCILLCRE
jgi:hypothetical protein